MRARAVLASLVVLSSSAVAKTWIVDLKGGGDFTTIPEAVAAAADGDVILVRSGVYPDAVTISKGLAIRAAGKSFTIANTLAITNVAAGSEVAVSGLKITGPPNPAGIEIADCDAAVVLEDVDLFLANDPFYENVCGLLVTGSANVAITRLTTPKSYATAYSYSPWPIVRIEESNVRCTDVTIEAVGSLGDGIAFVAPPGAHAIEATDSQLVLARTSSVGGEGAIGSSGGTKQWPGTNGGDGLNAVDTAITVLGTEADTIQGGRGGDGMAFLGGTDEPPGNGGDGIRLVGSSTLLISRETCAGGKGGKAGTFSHWPDGTDGTPIDGSSWSRLDLLPHLALSDDLTIGADATATIDGVASGAIFLMLADATGFAPPPGRAVGPPLALVAAFTFEVIPLGPTDAAGDVATTDAVLDDGSLVGLTLHLQAFELADSGAVYLTNAIDRVIGE